MILFWIGTVAELIKTFTVIIEVKKRNIPYKIIATGQNNLIDTDVLKACNDNTVNILLSDSSSIKKTSFGLLTWFYKTYRKSQKQLKSLFAECKSSAEPIIVVHGDTVSTLMGALVAKKNRVKLAHIEAGLRSFDLFHPFPEEIDRILTSKKVDYHFCPGDIPVENLRRVNTKGTIINTIHNTIYDGLQYANSQKFSENLATKIEPIKDNYFVFVMHRQENIANTALFKSTIEKIIAKSKSIHCVFILHEITRIALEQHNLILALTNEYFTLLPRVEYFDFMKILASAQFVITDGGSNQEELAYMGKPCLIMRTATERQDGLGENAVLCKNDFEVFDNFIENYQKYERKKIQVDLSPSEIIANKLQEIFYESY